MNLRLMSFFAGVLTLTFVVAPGAAQACNGGNKDQGTSETNLPETTQTSSAALGN